MYAILFLEAQWPVEFSSNLPQHICLEDCDQNVSYTFI